MLILYTCLLFLIQRLEAGVPALEFRDEGFHRLDHRDDLDRPRQLDQPVHVRRHVGVGVFPDGGHPDLLVRRRPGAFLGTQQLLVEFLAGTQARVLDLDIAALAQARQLDHPAGQVGDPHRLAHVEDEDLAATAHRPRLQHQPAGLGDGHEIADDIGMGHRHRAALGDLFPEAGDHRAVRAQHVAEAGRDEAGAARHLSPGDGQAQALHVDLRQALAAAHHVRRVDGLVGRDHHEALDAVADGVVGHHAGAVDVRPHRLAGVLLHQRHVLVGRRVEDDLGAPLAEDVVDPVGAPHVADDRDEVEVGEALLELQPEVVGGRLGVVQADQPADGETGQLAANLAADAPGGAGHQDGLVAEQGADLVEVDPDLVAAQQVLDAHLADGAADLPVADRLEPGRHEGGQVVGLAIAHQAFPLVLGGLDAGEDDAVDPQAGVEVHQVLVVVDPVDGLVGQAVMVFRGVEGHEADHLIGLQEDARRGRGQRDALVARAIDQHPFLPAAQLPQQQVIDVQKQDPEGHQQDNGEKAIRYQPDPISFGMKTDRAQGENYAHQERLDDRYHPEAPKTTYRGMPDDAPVAF